MIGRLVVNGRELDLTDKADLAIAVALIYSIADIKNPENRKRNSSLPFGLPGTLNNIDFLAPTFQLSLTAINAGSSDVGFKFDPTQRVSAQYYKYGKKIFDGLFQLLNVTVLNKNYTFNCCLFSNFIEVFQANGQKKMAELGWSQYDHILSNTVIQNSWDTSVMVDGVATPNFTAGVPDGYGYLYVLANYGYESNLRDHRNNNLVPHIYKKEFMEKCFAVANQTIDSDYIDSETFKRQLLGFGGGPKTAINPTEVVNRRVRYTGVGSYGTELRYSSYETVYDFATGDPRYKYTFALNQALIPADNFWSAVTVVNDPSTQLDENTGEVTCTSSEKRSITFTGTFNIDTFFHGTTLGSYGKFGIKASVFKNGFEIGTFNVTTFSSSATFILNQTLNLSVLSGDVLSVRLTLFTSPTLTITSLDIPANAPYFDYSLSNTGGDFTIDIQSLAGPVQDGDTVYIANYLPDILCSEVLKGIMTEANLYVSEPDRNGVVKIEPLENFFYDTTVFDDWTHKIDYSKQYTISPASLIEGKIYAFRFAEDNDYYNKSYREKYGIGYGDYNYQVQSTYQTGTRVYQLPWAQTVTVEVPGTNIILPTIINADLITGAVSPYKGKLRSYYYQGLKSCDSWVLRNSATPTTYDTLTSWPACGHVDDYITPTFDFNWNHPEQIYWTYTGNYPLNNLFSEHHEKFVKEVTGRDSKIWSVYVRLSPDDVQPDKMRWPAMVNGVLFRKNVIGPFNANGEQTTLVELIRIIAADSRRTLSTSLPANIGDESIRFGGDDIDGADPSVGILLGETDAVYVTGPVRFG